MPSSSTSTITPAGQIRFLHQPAGYISETLSLITALVTAAASILQWNRLTRTSRWRNSNTAWKKQTHKQQQQNPYYNQAQKPDRWNSAMLSSVSSIYKAGVSSSVGSNHMQGVTAVSYPQFALLNTFTYNWGGSICSCCTSEVCYSTLEVSLWQLLFQESILEAKF